MNIEEIIFKDARVHTRAVYCGKDGEAEVLRRLQVLREDVEIYIEIITRNKANKSVDEVKT